jgi:hypothetical protein
MPVPKKSVNTCIKKLNKNNKPIFSNKITALGTELLLPIILVINVIIEGMVEIRRNSFALRDFNDILKKNEKIVFIWLMIGI